MRKQKGGSEPAGENPEASRAVQERGDRSAHRSVSSTGRRDRAGDRGHISVPTPAPLFLPPGSFSPHRRTAEDKITPRLPAVCWARPIRAAPERSRALRPPVTRGRGAGLLTPALGAFGNVTDADLCSFNAWKRDGEKQICWPAVPVHIQPHGDEQGSPRLLQHGAGVTSVGRGAPRWDGQSPRQEESCCRGRSVTPKCSTPKWGNSPRCTVGSRGHPWSDPVPAPTAPWPPRRQGLPGAG